MFWGLSVCIQDDLSSCERMLMKHHRGVETVKLWPMDQPFRFWWLSDSGSRSITTMNSIYAYSLGSESHIQWSITVLSLLSSPGGSTAEV